MLMPKPCSGGFKQHYCNGKYTLLLSGCGGASVHEPAPHLQPPGAAGHLYRGGPGDDLDHPACHGLQQGTVDTV